jgi:tRNA dimethylallyltransferase
MRCVGYRQVWEALEQHAPLAEMRDKGIFATRQLAKRQITWLRSMPHRHGVAADGADAVAQIIALAKNLILH